MDGDGNHAYMESNVLTIIYGIMKKIKKTTYVNMQPSNTSCAEDHIFRRRKTDGTRPDLEHENIYESYEDISTRMERIKIEHIDSQEFRAKDIEILEDRKEGLEDQINKMGEELVYCGDKIQNSTRETITEIIAILQKNFIFFLPEQTEKVVVSAFDDTINKPLQDADIILKNNYYLECLKRSKTWNLFYINILKLLCKRISAKSKALSFRHSAKRWLCALFNKPADDEARKLKSQVVELSETVKKYESTMEIMKTEMQHGIN